jgi:hypothetical protein
MSNKFNWAREIVKHVFLHKYGQDPVHHRQQAEKLIWNAPREELDKLPDLPMKFTDQVREAYNKKMDDERAKQPLRWDVNR